MEKEAVTPSDFQRSTRMPLDAVVRLHFEGTVAYQNGFAANVSATGMFVKHPAPPPVGTPLVFEFSLGPQRKPVQGSGEVVWVRDRYLGPGQPAGIGIRFLQLDAQSRDHVAEALFEYLERSLSEDSYFDPQRLAGQIGAEPDAIASLEEALPRPTEPPPEPPSTPTEERPRPTVSFAPAATAAVEPAPVERQPFAVFSPLDNADPRTAAIVRQALRDAPAPPPARVAASAAAAPRRSASTALWLILAAALLGAGGWFAWQRWGAGAEPAAPQTAEAAPEPPARPQPEPLSAEPQPGTLAETVGVDPDVPSAAANPPVAGTDEPASGAPPEVEPEVATEPDPGAAEAAAASGITSPAVPVTTDSEPSPAPPAEPIRPATQVTALAWAEADSGVELRISGNGGFPAGSFTYSEIGGDKPRVLVRLRGMASAYRGAAPGDAPGVRGVRTGFHSGDRGHEVHVVVDLASPPARVVALTPAGDGLALRLAPPAR